MGKNVQFVSELPFPETNALLYREFYEYEQLLRRLAHAALTAKAGVKWGGDGAGNLFIADIDNHRIRKVSADGIITTVAGNGVPGFSGVGVGSIGNSCLSY